MEIKLSTVEQAMIASWRQLAVNRGPSAKGAFSVFYLNVRALLYPKLSSQNAAATNFVEVKRTYDWLIGASQVNEGVGLFGSFIRNYALRQRTLRYGTQFLPSGELNRASNVVAGLVADAFLAPGGSIPTVQRIGLDDLHGVREVLFANDPEVENNQAWPGMLLLSDMGQDFIGLVVRENAATTQSVFGSLLDLKQALLAFDSTKNALPSLSDAYGQLFQDSARNAEIATSQAIFGNATGALILGVLRNNVAREMIRSLTNGKNAEGSRLLRLVAGIGSEGTFNALHRAFGGDFAYHRTTEQSFANDVNAFFSQFPGAGESAIGATFLRRTASEISQDAQSNVAVRNALRALSPYVITPGSYAGRGLELYDASNVGGLTQQWIQDRALMMERLIYKAENAIDGPIIGFPFSENAIFSDVGSGVRLVVSGTAENQLKRYVFGSDQSDALLGGAQGDRLHGGAGSDLLLGGKLDDYMEGGAGMDVYVYDADTKLFVSTNDGNDTIFDTDGKGVLRYVFQEGVSSAIQTRVIGGAAIKQSATQWQSADGKFNYAKDGGDLNVTIVGDAGGTIKLKDFDFMKAAQTGYLGIRLTEVLSAPINPARSFYGDRLNWDSNPGTVDEIDPVDDGLGNFIRADGQGTPARPDNTLADRIDVFYGAANGSQANEGEYFTTAGGADVVFGDGQSSATSLVGGRDLIDLGAGRDSAFAGAGSDWVEGGTDGDFLYGGEGDDVIWANSSNGRSVTLAQAITAGESGAQGAGNDLISGDAGRDVLIGAAGADLIGGGSDEDLIVGGAGNDMILADAVLSTVTSLAWTTSVQRQFFTDQAVTTPTVTNMSYTGTPEAGAADTVYAGAGDDFVSSGAGDDYVEGGIGNDDLAGGAGSDILIGGVGDDVLGGDTDVFTSGTVSLALQGDDYLDGGDGSDWLAAGGGSDVLIGGAVSIGCTARQATTSSSVARATTSLKAGRARIPMSIT